MVNDIEEDPEAAAKGFAGLSFSTAVTRLERIGEQIALHPFREQFARALAKLDGPKAAVVLRPKVTAYSPECREFVVSKVAELLKSRMRAEQALATELLGRLSCEESRNAITAHWTANPASKRVHPLVSNAAISHGILPLVPHVFRTWWFTQDNYFVDLRPELLATTESFRDSLTEYASNFIPSEEHSDNYRRALMVLSYLGDERAVGAIKQRTQEAIPFFYESMCLLAIGSQQAMDLYSSLIDRYVEAKKAGLEHDDDFKLHSAFVSHAQIANLVTSEVEEFVCRQIDSEETERQLIGRFLAKWLGTERLLLYMVKRWHVEGYLIFGEHGFGQRLAK